VEAGKQLFARSACSACHGVDGKTEMLGPNLNGISNTMTREEILEDIMEPSKRIKPAQTGLRVTKKDGQVLLGRVVNTSDQSITLMLMGNQLVQVSRKDIASTEELQKSMMYENLLKSLSKEEVESLLDYIVSLK
jgi:putative heme-binding domain-containing protein